MDENNVSEAKSSPGQPRQDQQEAQKPRPRRRRKLLRRLAVGLLTVAVLAVVAVFYLTSEHFIRHFVVPRIEKKTGRTIDFQRLKIRLFHGAETEGLEIGPVAGESKPLLQSKRLAVEWYFWSLVRKRLHMRSIRADGLQLAFVQRETPARTPSTPPPARAGANNGSERNPDDTREKGPTSLSVDTLSVTNASLEMYRPAEREGQPGSRYLVHDLAVEGSQLGLDRPATLDVKARIEADDTSQGVALSDGAIALNVQSQVQPDGKAFTLEGTWAVDGLRGAFHGANAKDLRATGVLVLEQPRPDSLVIHQADALVSRQGRTAADVALRGELNPATGDGRIRLHLRRIDRSFLNLLSTPARPLDFRDTVASVRLNLETSEAGTRRAFDGDVRLSDFSVVAPGIADAGTPLTQTTVRYHVVYVDPAKTLTFERLEALVSQQGRDVITANLTAPMTIPLIPGRPVKSRTAADLRVRVDRLSLPQLNPLLAPTGLQVAGGQLSVDAAFRASGQQGAVATSGSIRLADFRAKLADQDLGRTDIDADCDLVSAPGEFSIRKLSCDVRKDGRPAGRIGGTGTIDTAGSMGGVVLSGEDVDLSALQAFLVRVPGVRLRAGLVDFSQKVSFVGEKKPVDLEGQFQANGLAFDVPGKERARYRNWTIGGRDRLRVDRAKRSADIESLSFEASEKGLGGISLTAKGQLQFEQRTAALDVDVAQVAVPFLASVLDRLGTQAEGAIRPTAGSLSGKAQLKLGGAGDLALKGNLATKQLRWTVGTGSAAKTTGRDLDLAYDLGLAGGGRGDLTVRELLLQVGGAGASAGSLRLAGQLDLAKTAGDLDVQFKRFDTEPVLALAGPLLGEWRPVAGVLDGRQAIGLKMQSAREISARGTLRAERLLVMPPDSASPIGPHSLEIDNDLALLEGGKAIRLDRLRLRVLDGEAAAGTLDVSGNLNFAAKRGRLQVAAEKFDTARIWPIAAALGKDIPISGGRLDGKQEINFSIDRGEIVARGDLRADAVRVRPATGAEPTAPLRFDLKNDLTLGPEKTDVRSFVLATYSGGKPFDRIEMAARGGGLKSNQTMDVSLKAPTLHLDTYLALLPSGTSADKEKGPSKTPGPPRRAAGEAAGFAIPGPPVRASIDVGEFFFDRVYARTVKGQVGVTSPGVRIDQLTMQLVDGAATATGWLRTDQAGLPYSANIQGQGMAVAPLLTMIKPGLGEKISGTGSCTINVTGRGFDKAAVRQNLRCQGAFRIRDGELQRVPILNALASVTGVNTLAEVIRFFQFEGKWTVERGVVTIPELFLIGRLQKIRTKGTVDFDQNVDLTFDLWLGGELKDRLRDKRIVKYLVTESDRFLRLPVPIGMGGTLSKPRPSLKLPTDAILDIGIEQGMKALEEYLQKRNREKQP